MRRVCVRARAREKGRAPGASKVDVGGGGSMCSRTTDGGDDDDHRLAQVPDPGARGVAGAAAAAAGNMGGTRRSGPPVGGNFGNTCVQNPFSGKS